MSAHIYVLKDPVSKEIRYVGKAFDIDRRYRQHLRNSNYEKSHKWNWIYGLKQIGLKPELEVLEIFPDEPSVEWQEAERFWISYLSFLGMRLTNLDSGGIGGKRVSDETKVKLRAWQVGRKFSPEHRAKLSAARKGIKLTEAHKAAIRRNSFGKTFSPERCAKIAASKIGIKRSPETVAKILATKLRNFNERKLRTTLRWQGGGHKPTPSSYAVNNRPSDAGDMEDKTTNKGPANC